MALHCSHFDRYLVAWRETKAHVTAVVYYQGWVQCYGEPMYSHDIRDGLPMSRGGAYKAAARLRDHKKWGVDAYVIACPDNNIRLQRYNVKFKQTA